MDKTSAHTTEWCQGLALSEVRTLTPEERAVLSAAFRRLSWQGWLCVGVWALPMAILTPLRNSLFSSHYLLLLWSVWMGAAFFVCLAGAYWAFTTRSKFRAELADGRVKRFGIDSSEELEPHLAQSLELLCPTHRLWRINGEDNFIPRESLPVANVANPKPVSDTERLARGQGETKTGQLAVASERKMTAAERFELKNISRYPRIGFLLGAPLSSLYAAYEVYWSLNSQVPTDFSHKYEFIFNPVCTTILALALDVAIVRTVLSARKIRQDLRFGTILISHPTNLDDDELQSYTVEQLPKSGLRWTVDGVPAHWRTNPSATLPWMGRAR